MLQLSKHEAGLQPPEWLLLQVHQLSPVTPPTQSLACRICAIVMAYHCCTQACIRHACSRPNCCSVYAPGSPAYSHLGFLGLWKVIPLQLIRTPLLLC